MYLEKRQPPHVQHRGTRACIDRKFCCFLRFLYTMSWHVEHISFLWFCLQFCCIQYISRINQVLFFSISPDKTISNETIELESFKVQQFALFNRDLHFKFNLFPSWIVILLQFSSDNCDDCYNKIVNSSRSKFLDDMISTWLVVRKLSNKNYSCYESTSLTKIQKFINNSRNHQFSA